MQDKAVFSLPATHFLFLDPHWSEMVHKICLPTNTRCTEFPYNLRTESVLPWKQSNLWLWAGASYASRWVAFNAPVSRLIQAASSLVMAIFYLTTSTYWVWTMPEWLRTLTIISRRTSFSHLQNIAVPTNVFHVVKRSSAIIKLVANK